MRVALALAALLLALWLVRRYLDTWLVLCGGGPVPSEPDFAPELRGDYCD